MSSSEPRSRRHLLGLAGLCLAFGLGGCFRPLYGDATTSVAGGSVKSSLTAIEVGPIGERIGHYLRNELVFDLDGSGAETRKRFQLDVTATENVGVTVTDYSTGAADSATLVITAKYKLIEHGRDKPLTEGEVVARATYDRTTQRFANVRAARDAQIRAAKQLSELIRNRLAAGFAGGF